MKRYDYFAAVKADVLAWIRDAYSADEIRGWADLSQINFSRICEEIYDSCWCDDAVTGNGTSSYWASVWEAEEALTHNWSLLAEAVDDFDGDPAEVLRRGPEFADALIRCYVLSDAVDAALVDLFRPEAGPTAIPEESVS